MIDTGKLLTNISNRSTSLSRKSVINIGLIRDDVKKIDGMLKMRLVLSKVREGIEKQNQERLRRKSSEETLEKDDDRDDDDNRRRDPQPKKGGGGGLIGALISGVLSVVGGMVLKFLPQILFLGKLIAKLSKPFIFVAAGSLGAIGGFLSQFNRTKELDGIAVQYSNLMEVVNDVDVVITATGAPGTLINFEEMNKTIQLRQNTPLLIMDIGLPRDVEPRVSDLPNVTYFDMEALQEIAAENGKARAQEIGAAEHLIEEELKEFSVWLENLQTQPTIASLSARSEKIRKDAVEKSLQRLHLDEAQQDEIDALTRAIVKRILHDPIVALREYGNQDTHYVEVVHKLFGLNDEFSSLTDLSVSEQPEDDRL